MSQRSRMPKFTIAGRLVVVILATGLTAFGLMGIFTDFLIRRQIVEQDAILSTLSERQFANTLEGSSMLARSRVEAIGSQTAQTLRQIARRPDVSKAIASNNEATIRETLRGVADATGVDRLIAFDDKGLVTGTNVPVDLLSFQMHISATRIVAGLRVLLSENSRANSTSLSYMHKLAPLVAEGLGLANRPTLAFVAVEPVFDDFGDVIGAVAGIRPLGVHEPALVEFSMLSKRGLAIMRGNEVFAITGPAAQFDETADDGRTLQRSLDEKYVARCAKMPDMVRICSYIEASVVGAARTQMTEISTIHGQQQVRQILTLSGLMMLAMIVACVLALHRIMRGMSPLAAAANAIAAGQLDTPFQASGVGEIHRLGVAFETMIANLRASTAQISKLAFFDGVTRLPNRERMVAVAPRLLMSGEPAALLFLDLDGFKGVNDSLGHKMGDQLLAQVSERILVLLAGSDAAQEHVLSRLGGDEFGLLIKSDRLPDVAPELADQIIDALRLPFSLGGNTVSIGVSIGIALFPSAGATYEQLLVNADLAMYAAKSGGRNTFVVYTDALSNEAQERRLLETELIKVIRNEELSVHYQPKILCGTGQVKGVEALARWFHPERGTISPGIFVKLAEDAGLIRDLGRVILKKSLRDIGQLIELGHDLVLSVNVTASDIEDPKFARMIIRMLRELEFPPSRLELEITESIAARNAELIQQRMQFLRQFGVRFSMDDFGAGYSNLATIARLPFDAIKIDRSLVHGVSNDPERQPILRVAIDLASELGFETVVEGVEHAADMDLASQYGATYIQGYIFSPPVSIDKFIALLDPAQALEPIAAASLLSRRRLQRVKGLR